MMVEMHKRSIEMIREERAARASSLPIRTEHEVIDDQLAAAIEEIGKRFPAGRRIENIVFLDLHPGQGHALRIDAIAQMRCLLLAGKQLTAGLQPYVSGNDLVHCQRPPPAFSSSKS